MWGLRAQELWPYKPPTPQRPSLENIDRTDGQRHTGIARIESFSGQDIRPFSLIDVIPG